MKLFLLLSIVISVCLGEGENVFYINNLGDFIIFSVNVNSGNDYSSTTVYLNSSLDFNGIESFTPIGTEGNSFRGTFDGQGYVIYNFTINSTGRYAGLFGHTEDATIKNVILDESCTITSNSTSFKYEIHVGSICGKCKGDCTISGNINKGSVTYTGSGGDNCYIGGIVGYCEGDCKSENNVNKGNVAYTGSGSLYSYIGGIVGRCKEGDNKYTINGNMNLGTVTYSGTSTRSYIGGIVGYSDEGLIIQGCVNYGSIEVNGACKSFYAGGILGGLNEESNIMRCHNFETIHSNCTATDDNFIGGIAGKSYKNSRITRCISDGMIEGNIKGVTIGAICGSTATKTDVSNCYYNENICNVSAGCIVAYGSTPYNETNSSSVLSSLASANNMIVNTNGATLKLKVNCEVIATLSSKMIILPISSSSTSSQWYTNSECTNIFSLSEITENTTLYQRIGSYSDICDLLTSSSFSSSSSTSSMSSSSMLHFSSYSSSYSSSSSSPSSSISSSSSSSSTFPSSSTSLPSLSSSISSLPSSSIAVSSISTSLPHSSSLLSLLSSSSSSSSPPSTEAPTEYVQITFSKKDLTEEEVDKIIHEITKDKNYTIIKIEKGDKLTVIIKFDDVEAAKHFVNSVNSGRYENIESTSYITRSTSYSSSLKISKLLLYYINFLISFLN